jgi:dCTP deaminase
VLHPGKFVLGITLEWLRLPGDLAGYVTGKSSLGRRGLIIETAAGVQPGFAGCLTLELANVGEIPVKLVPGMKICQLFLHKTMSVNSRASSQFKGARKPGLGVIR